MRAEEAKEDACRSCSAQISQACWRCYQSNMPDLPRTHTSNHTAVITNCRTSGRALLSPSKNDRTASCRSCFGSGHESSPTDRDKVRSTLQVERSRVLTRPRTGPSVFPRSRSIANNVIFYVRPKLGNRLQHHLHALPFDQPANGQQSRLCPMAVFGLLWLNGCWRYWCERRMDDGYSLRSYSPKLQSRDFV